jgi:hypothetical protein
VAFDVAAWFTAADRTLLDPSDEANRPAIEQRILTSMAAYAQIEHEIDDD